MVRFIFGCAFVLALSILAVPVFYGISSQKNVVTTTADAGTDNSLSFDDIYTLADSATPSAESLNNIATAAGAESGDTFSSGFQNADNPALADTPAPETTEPSQENTN